MTTTDQYTPREDDMSCSSPIYPSWNNVWGQEGHCIKGHWTDSGGAVLYGKDEAGRHIDLCPECLDETDFAGLPFDKAFFDHVRASSAAQPGEDPLVDEYLGYVDRETPVSGDVTW